jgi:protein O-mannosyl-transferase
MPTKTKTAPGKRSPVMKAKPKKPGSRSIPHSVPVSISLGRIAAICFLLVTATILVYSSTGKHPFANYDDGDYVVQNAHVTAGLTWDTVTWALTAIDASNWHPLTWLSHALDCQLFGLNPSGHHWTSVVIHALNVVLLFLLLWRATGATGRSLLVAALFALHPLNVESVVWIAERKNVLSMFFFLLTLGAYSFYARKPNLRRYVAVVVLFVLALAAKPMVITLPFVLLLLDYWPLRRIQNWSEPSATFPVPQFALPRLIVEKLPLLAFSAASAIITVVAQGESVIPTLALPLSVRLLDALYAYAMYMWKAFWPISLALIYPHPGRTLSAWQIGLSAILLLALSIMVWRQRVARPCLAVGWLWFLGTAVPVIGIIQVGVQVIADRYAYLPLIGIFVMFAWSVSDLADRFALPLFPRAAALALMLAALSLVTSRQIGTWKTSVEVWTHALQVTKNNSIAESNLTNALFDLKRYDEGMVHLRNYARLEPLDPKAHVRVGADFQDRGQLADAVREYETAFRAAAILQRSGLPNNVTPQALAMTHANLSVIYVQLGDSAKARLEMTEALQTDAEAVDRMIAQFAQYIATHPAAPGYVRLGLLLNQAGRVSEAKHAFAQARQLDPQIALPAISEQIAGP